MADVDILPASSKWHFPLNMTLHSLGLRYGPFEIIDKYRTNMRGDAVTNVHQLLPPIRAQRPLEEKEGSQLCGETRSTTIQFV